MSIPNPLSEKTTAEIEILSRKISVAQELDGEIRAELRGHIEDKVRGYVSGMLKVSEADALLLAKEHFGDTAVIKAMFQRTHSGVHVLSFGKRVLIASAIYLFVGNLLTLVGDNILSHSSLGKPFTSVVNGDIPPNSFFAQLFNLLIGPTVGLLIINHILRVWRRRVNELPLGLGRAWFAIFLLCLGLIFGIFIQAPILNVAFYPGMPGIVWIVSRTSMTSLAMPYSLAVVSILAFTTAFSGVVWTAWYDQSPRTMHSILPAILSWMLFLLLSGPTTFLALLFTAIRHPSMLGWVWFSIPYSVVGPWDIRLLFYLTISLFVFLGYSIRRNASHAISE